MAGYDPQKARRRPRAADTGEAPVDALLRSETSEAPSGSDESASGVVSVPSPTVTPPPPIPDPDPRLMTAAAVAGAITVVAGGLLIRRWWRSR